jgi:hypothetical protein
VKLLWCVSGAMCERGDGARTASANHSTIASFGVPN